MMKKRFKITEETTYDELLNYLEELYHFPNKIIDLKIIRKICQRIGAEEVKATGSSVRFYHRALEMHPYYKGYFQVHKKHKGGTKQEISRTDFRKYLYGPLKEIINFMKTN